ncbi:MAG: RecQ family ATP-dependent DNA helicase [Xanthomonadales bacterium]|nr:RecQ family ATP-dependent DNA helicase [Xanthomonadales bacterium]
MGAASEAAGADVIFAPKALCIDIETAYDDPYQLRKLAAWRSDTGVEYSTTSIHHAADLESRINSMSQGAAFVVGHNIVQHDLPVLLQHFPSLLLHTLPVIDTLLLSPIAFPQNPYHRLIKDYKLISDARSDPLRDAHLSLQLWHDQVKAFARLQIVSPDEMACHHYLLTRSTKSGVGALFALVRRAMPPDSDQVRQSLLRLMAGKVCSTQVAQLIDACLVDAALALPLAYLIAWLRVSGGNSVIPPWVRLNYPQVRQLQRQLRDVACGEADCVYCRERLDPCRDLQRYFGFTAFRSEPCSADGDSLQKEIVCAAYAQHSLLAILPTGAGKSVCYQLPGLSTHWRNGGLTVVVSPLQSLMKDQVDGLVKKGIYTAAALNGLLSMPERRDVLDRLRLGDIGLVLVSPEQFRNQSFTKAIKHREVSAWVFDEAHCLSKWGNDFRPDYLYVSRFIREHHGTELAPIWCSTATARREVVEDLRKHFREALNIELVLFDGGHERNNLHYEVMKVNAAEKLLLIQQLLQHELADPAGGAIVFASKRARCEEIAGYLKDLGWSCAHFHAGVETGLKKDIQQAFIAGDLRVIVATNAFGMGVDKPDVRLVVHADIPGSLENYLQEAGRAGRDQEQSRCVLLYDEEDVEAQFSIAARSRLSRTDIAGILRSLRRYSSRMQSAEIVVTPGEILGDDTVQIAIESGAPDADTKVRTAVAWLERARIVQRDENHVRVFPGSLRVDTLDEATKRLERADLSDEQRGKFNALLTELINADDTEGINTDDLMVRLGVTSDQCMRMLRELNKLEILSNDIEMTMLLRKGVADASSDRFVRYGKIETALLEILPELAPDAAEIGPQSMDLRALRERVGQQAGVECQSDELLRLMRSLARPFGDGEETRRAMFDVRVIHREVLRVKVLRSWTNICEISSRRRGVAAVILQQLLSKLSPQLRGIDLRVVCKIGELSEALRSDMVIGPQLKDEMRAIEAGLLYLHDNSVLIIDRGKSVFRAAMTLRLDPAEKQRRFSKADYVPLADHYTEKNFQVHVIQEYARRGIEKLSDALAFVMAYFSLSRKAFIQRYFADRRDILERAATMESWRRIVEDLRHPLQQAMVTADVDGNRLVLAGPGSGKTRVIVHRVAYLVRILREPPQSVVVLAFNRTAAWDIRQRLGTLIGADAFGVTVLTYHALALRLTGRSYAGMLAQQAVDFDGILDDALAMLEGRTTGTDGVESADDADLRDRLLAGYRHILVDEYQDVDERQYRLISALAGRQLLDADAKLTLLAVGDDDQNIYAFRDTSNEFIRRFQEDYAASPEYLVENYRSSAQIITAANVLIAVNAERLKDEHPIRINHARRADPLGGRWQRLDPVGKGRVQVLQVACEHKMQAEQVMAELVRIKSLDSDTRWSDCAVLARNHASLEPIRAWCELADVDVCTLGHSEAQPRLTQTREACTLIDLLWGKPRRTVHGAALVRWFAWHFGGGRDDNPWERLLLQFIEELHANWADSRVPTALVVDALYEFAHEEKRAGGHGLVLSTVHGAKGREFRHVVMLDGGEWKQASDDERRLYYVGMTRARENLFLCESRERTNPFTAALCGPDILRTLVPVPSVLRPQLGRRYLTLGQKDVDIGFAGRRHARDQSHQALADLRHGDVLELVQHGDKWELYTSHGDLIGKLAAATNLPKGQVICTSVESVIRRTRGQTQPEYQRALQVDTWWVVLPSLVLEADIHG